jgi:hypothetical protein
MSNRPRDLFSLLRAVRHPLAHRSSATRSGTAQPSTMAMAWTPMAPRTWNSLRNACRECCCAGRKTKRSTWTASPGAVARASSTAATAPTPAGSSPGHRRHAQVNRTTHNGCLADGARRGARVRQTLARTPDTRRQSPARPRPATRRVSPRKRSYWPATVMCLRSGRLAQSTYCCNCRARAPPASPAMAPAPTGEIPTSNLESPYQGLRNSLLRPAAPAAHQATGTHPRAKGIVGARRVISRTSVAEPLSGGCQAL